MDADEYLTVRKESRGEYNERNSEFLAFLKPSDGEDERRKVISYFQKEYPSATHHVWASRIRSGSTTKEASSDCGEPPGSAGQPVLNVLKKNKLTNCTTVVIRYYGGKELGIKGLRRAYSKATKNALHNNTIVKSYIKSKIKLQISYKLAEQIEGTLTEETGKIISKQYGKNVKLTLLIRQKLQESFLEKVSELSSGQADIQIIDGKDQQ